jgi:hypothetical protein
MTHSLALRDFLAACHSAYGEDCPWVSYKHDGCGIISHPFRHESLFWLRIEGKLVFTLNEQEFDQWIHPSERPGRPN